MKKRKVLIIAEAGVNHNGSIENAYKMIDVAKAAGADIIIGHHPHVLQPIEWIEKNKHRTLVVYSLGNFISAQKNDYKDIGGMVKVSISKEWSSNGNKATVDDVSFTPTYVTNQNYRDYRIKPFNNEEVFGQEKTSKQELTDFMLDQLSN